MSPPVFASSLANASTSSWGLRSSRPKSVHDRHKHPTGANVLTFFQWKKVEYIVNTVVQFKSDRMLKPIRLKVCYVYSVPLCSRWVSVLDICMIDLPSCKGGRETDNQVWMSPLASWSVDSTNKSVHVARISMSISSFFCFWFSDWLKLVIMGFSSV